MSDTVVTITTPHNGKSVTLSKTKQEIAEDFARWNAKKNAEGSPATREQQEESAADLIPRLVPPTDFYKGEVYRADPAIATLADVIIARHDMPAAKFTGAYLWKQKSTRWFGACRKADPDLAFFTGYDYVIYLAANKALEHRLTPYQLEAVLYHELRHVGSDEEGRIVLLRHEFEGFRDELDIYGAYMADFAAAKAHFEQASLLPED